MSTGHRPESHTKRDQDVDVDLNLRLDNATCDYENAPNQLGPGRTRPPTRTTRLRQRPQLGAWRARYLFRLRDNRRTQGRVPVGGTTATRRDTSSAGVNLCAAVPSA